MGQRYDFLRVLCNIGKVIGVIAIVGGLLLLLSGGSYGVSPAGGVVIMALGAGAYIGLEAVGVLIAIEANTRAAAHLLNRLVDRGGEPDEAV